MTHPFDPKLVESLGIRGDSDDPDERAEWLRARRRGLGGSDAAAILGLDPYTSALEVYADKVTDFEPDESQHEAARWGRIFERPILNEYGKRREAELVGGGELLRSRRHPFLLVTLDDVQLAPDGPDSPGIVDCKTTRMGWRYADELPAEVQVQLQVYMMVTGTVWGTCVWLPFPERVLQWIDVFPNEAFQEVLLAKLAEFWERVQRRDPPPPDHTESTRKALQRLYPNDSGKVVQVPGPEAIALLDARADCQLHIKAAEKRKAEIDNQLRATIEGETFATLDDGRYWSLRHRAESERRCGHCNEVIERKAAHRRLHVSGHLKKPKLFDEPVATRQLVDPLVKALEDSTEGPAADRVKKDAEKKDDDGVAF